MKVAIVGAGFAGLALCRYLVREGVEVVMFDSLPIGEGGASSIAAGLMHPYPGEQARRSWKADEALEVTKELLSEATKNEPVADFSGIVRYALNDSQKEHLIKRSKDYSDVKRVSEEAFLITSGITVYSQRYMKGLWSLCEGAEFKKEKIDSLEELDSFDAVVLANGAGALSFPEVSHLKLKKIKGQVLKCSFPDGLLTKSIVGKGYVALSHIPNCCYVGATFERDFTDEWPHQKEAHLDLFQKIAPFFPQIESLEIQECRAAFRVTREGSYLPLVEKIGEKTWYFGAFGSRGLLYHAFFAKQLSRYLSTSYITPII